MPAAAALGPSNPKRNQNEKVSTWVYGWIVLELGDGMDAGPPYAGV